MVTTQKLDIFDSNLFDLESIHTLEFIESDKPFRWSDGYFKIKPKKELNNLCLNFICIGGEKKLVIFMENKYKNIKHEKMLTNGKEYVICISLKDVDLVSFYVTPNMKVDDKEIRTLGLFIKRIYTNEIDTDSLNLISSSEKCYDDYLKDTNIVDEKKFNEIEFKEQVKDIKFLDLNYTHRNFEFNSSIFEFNNKKYLMVRNSQFVSKKMTLNSLKLYEYESYLSDLVDNIPFTFVKMDIEGCEIEALKGAENFIRKYKPKMFIEVNIGSLKRKNYTEKDFLDIIYKYGYFCIPCPLSRGNKMQYDVLCIPI